VIVPSARLPIDTDAMTRHWVPKITRNSPTAKISR
jgi:hypothetical protein